MSKYVVVEARRLCPYVTIVKDGSELHKFLIGPRDPQRDHLTVAFTESIITTDRSLAAKIAFALNALDQPK